MAPGAKQVLQVVTHDVSGVHAWMGMVDGMNAADPAPPHMALIKRFFFGPQKLGTVGGECRAVHTRCEATDAIDQRSVVHCVEGEENLKAVNELFALDGPFLKGFFESPVMKGKEVSCTSAGTGCQSLAVGGEWPKQGRPRTTGRVGAPPLSPGASAPSAAAPPAWRAPAEGRHLLPTACAPCLRSAPRARARGTALRACTVRGPDADPDQPPRNPHTSPPCSGTRSRSPSSTRRRR